MAGNKRKKRRPSDFMAKQANARREAEQDTLYREGRRKIEAAFPDMEERLRYIRILIFNMSSDIEDFKVR